MAPGSKNKFGAALVEPAPPWSTFGAPVVKSDFFQRQIYCIEESTCEIVGTFPRHQQTFGAPPMIRRPGNCAPVVTPLVDTSNWRQEETRRTRTTLFGQTKIAPRASGNEALCIKLVKNGCFAAHIQKVVGQSQTLYFDTSLSEVTCPRMTWSKQILVNLARRSRLVLPVAIRWNLLAIYSFQSEPSNCRIIKIF